MRFAIIGIACIALQLVWLAPDAAGLQAGVGKVELIPPADAPLAGHLYRHGRSAVVQDSPLWVRSLYLEQNGTALVWVSLDIHAVSPDLRQRVRELAPGGLPPDHIILTATHTHNGPGGYDTSLLFRKYSGRYLPEWLELMAQSVVQSIETAMENQKRATIGIAQSSVPALVQSEFNSDESPDTALGVIRVDDSDGSPMALIASVGARAATLGREQSLAFSGDFPGVYADALEEMTPDGCVAFFVNGSSGDQVCANPDSLAGPAWATWMGEQLAQQTKAVSNSITGREVSLSFYVQSYPVPVSLAGEFLPDEFAIQAIGIDKTLVSFWPGSLFGGFSDALRNAAKKWGYTRHFPVGMANGNFMALAPPEGFSVEMPSSLNLFGPDILPWSIEALKALLGEESAVESSVAYDSTPVVREFAGGTHVAIAGDAVDLGYSLGLARLDDAQQVLSDRVYPLVRADGMAGPWGRRSRVDMLRLQLPFYFNEKRGLFGKWRDDDRVRLRHFASGAGLTFHEAALLESYEATSQDGEHVSTLAGAMFSVTDDKAGKDGLLVGRTLRFPRAVDVRVVEVLPEKGRRYAYVGVPWQSGAYAGMNDAGVVVCAEWLEADSPPPYRLAAGYAIRSLLASQNSFEKALAFLETQDVWEGFRLLVADRPKSDAVVLEYGEELTTIRSEAGLLLPGQAGASGDVVETLLHIPDDGSFDLAAVQDIVTHRPAWSASADRVFTSDTFAAIVFQPETKQIHVSTPDGDGNASDFYTIDLSGEAP